MDNSVRYPWFIAKFYDVIYDQIRSHVDSDFFLEEITQASGPVLEVGTGTGRLFRQALSKGADMYGIDISDEMLHVLKNKIEPAEHHRVSQQNITDFTLNKQFSLIIAPFRVFSHLVTIEEQLQALNNVHKHLIPGGTFIFDLFVPNLEMLVNGLENEVDFEKEYEPGKVVRRLVDMKTDIIRQVNQIKMSLVWMDDNGEHIESWEFPMRYYFRYELEHLIARSPLAIEKIYGDYNKNLLNADSKEFVIVCRKL